MHLPHGLSEPDEEDKGEGFCKGEQALGKDHKSVVEVACDEAWTRNRTRTKTGMTPEAAKTRPETARDDSSHPTSLPPGTQSKSPRNYCASNVAGDK